MRVEKKKTEDNEVLSNEDYQMITTIVLGWFLLWNLLMKLTPEEYAEKVFLKIGKSKKKPATIRLLFNLLREKSNSIKSPDEFNQVLTGEMLDQSVEAVVMDKRSQHINHEHLKPYLDSRRISEILQYLKDRRVLRHIRGKQDIRKEMHQLPGRAGSHSFVTYGERFGGKPSAYKKTDLMENLTRLFQKTQARSLVYAALKEANILYECERFMLSAFYIALKRSKRRNMRKNISLVQGIIKATNNRPLETWKIKSLQNQIVNRDENQLKRFAADRAKESLQIQKEDSYFLMGLFKY